MKLVVKDNTNIYDIKEKLSDELGFTRFRGLLIVENAKTLRISKIRLAESKIYCGSHPNACDVAGGRKANFLEGSDWVEFNDRLNDVLDSMGVSANVYSTVCWLRRGEKRRIIYNSYKVFNGYEWERDGQDSDYEDYRGKVAPASEYPEGTPGLYARNR